MLLSSYAMAFGAFLFVVGEFEHLTRKSMRSPNVRHKSDSAILFIDVINHFEFPEGPDLLKNALKIAPRLIRLRDRAHKQGVPVVYVNDNFGQWRSERSKLIEYCTRPELPGHNFVKQIAPEGDDYFILKPMHSAFYQTALDVLLRHFEASELILCGVSTNNCIVCTAHDARMRDLKITIASDCCASPRKGDHEAALKHLKKTTDAQVLASSSIRIR